MPHAVAWRFSVADARQVLNAKKADQTDCLRRASLCELPSCESSEDWKHGLGGESHLRKLWTCMSPVLIVSAQRGIYAVRRRRCIVGRARSDQEIKVRDGCATPRRRPVKVHVSSRRPSVVYLRFVSDCPPSATHQARVSEETLRGGRWILPFLARPEICG